MLKRCTFITEITITYDDEQRLVFINSRALRLGFCQYTLLAFLLAKQEGNDNALSLALYRQGADHSNKALVRKNISKLRSRLRTYGLDVRRVHDRGYRLVSAVGELV